MLAGDGKVLMTMASQADMGFMTDAEVIARLIGGDNHALAEVYRRHGARVFSVANAVVRDRAAAEDVCQDVFLQLARQPQKFDGGRGSLSTYLAVVAHGRAVDRVRAESARARREEHHARLAPSTGESTDAQAIASSTAADLWAAVSSLPATEAEALRLAYFGGSTYRDVATILNVAEGTIKSRIRSGLKRLRSAFIEQGVLTST
jgi:RNA polymerase sigma-70 factor (ECF subfamily)